MVKTLDIWDIFELLSHNFGLDPIDGEFPTNKMILTGEMGLDLRCVIFSYFWENSPELRETNPLDYDGKDLKNERFLTKTVSEREILDVILKSDFYSDSARIYPKSVKLSGRADDETLIAEVFF